MAIIEENVEKIFIFYVESFRIWKMPDIHM